jgi:hypothetical protein
MTLADRMAIKRVSDPRIFKNPKNAELWYKSVGDWCDRRTKQ